MVKYGKKHTEVTDDILSYIDVLVAGPFILKERDITYDNLWRGSRNQKVIDVKKSILSNKVVLLENIPNNK